MPISPRPLGCHIPLTAVQLYSWKYLTQQGTPLSVRMCAAALRVVGPLNIRLLEQSIDAVVNRHESLRTRFTADGGVPTQEIDPEHSHRLDVIDVAQTRSRSENDEQLALLVGEFIDQKIDLCVGPLFAARLWRLSDSEHVLVLALDHIVGDSISNVILTREVWSTYDRGAEGLPLRLPPPALQFPDYAVWQEQASSAWREQHESYWQSNLEGALPVRFPLDDSAETSTRPVAAVRHFGFGAALSAQLRQIAHQERMQLPVVVLTAYVLVMSQWCRQSDLVVNLTLHGRHHRPELEGMIGLLAGFTLLRIDMTRDVTLLGLLRRVHETFSAALEHREYFMVPDTYPAGITEIGFNWLPAHTTGESTSRMRIGSGDIRVLSYAARGISSMAKFVPFFYDSKSGIGLSVHYRPDQVTPARVQRFCNDLRRAASDLAQNPQACLAPLMAQQ